ncbi:MAG TPA: hypothetical protein ENN29_05470 [Candidatus Hydrogenedentes bacterium]|nr:hypothetical protein [Candidatus Hydrogenedentota bacterium]
MEVSGILKACAVSLLKVSSDLRLMASGPDAGFGEIILPKMQAGYSIMPGKVNPVIPEAVGQAAMTVMGNDQVIAMACAQGNLELNAFMPLIADCLLRSCDLLTNACDILRERCVVGIEADEAQCRRHVNSDTAAVTALVAQFGYERASEIFATAKAQGMPVREYVVKKGILTDDAFNALVSPEAVCRLGF